MLPGTNVSTNSSVSNPRVFYGWFVVAGTFAVTFVGFGCAYSFSAFLLPLQHDFAASRGSISLVFSIAGFFYFVLGVISGPLADRFGSRLSAVIGMILTAGLWSQASRRPCCKFMPRTALASAWGLAVLMCPRSARCNAGFCAGAVSRRVLQSAASVSAHWSCRRSHPC